MTVKKTKPVTCKCEDNTARANAMYAKLSNQICEAEENLMLQIDKIAETNDNLIKIMGNFTGVCRNKFDLINIKQNGTLNYIDSRIKLLESNTDTNIAKATWYGISIGLLSGLIANLIFFGGRALWAYLS